MKEELKNMNKNYKKITKKDAKKAILILKDYYQDAKCGLDYSTPFSLVVALILAAQCTDARVNLITPIFFNKYKTIEDIANANINEIENIIKPCGFYKNKAKSIKNTAILLKNDFNLKVPNTMEDLTKLPGIGRKSANIILQECFGKTVGIAVDTHVTRISRKIGLTDKNTQSEIEQDLMKKVDKQYWSTINHIFVWHGRKICIARRPNCNNCPIFSLCKKND